jgi:hypothetical protein
MKLIHIIYFHHYLKHLKSDVENGEDSNIIQKLNSLKYFAILATK